MQILETIVFVLAISLDTFAAAICFGVGGVMIEAGKSAVIAFVCTLFFAASVYIGVAFGDAMPERFGAVISFFILTAIGFIRLVHSDKTEVRSMNMRQTIVFAASMSVDGLFAGFGAGVADFSMLSIPLSFATVFCAVFFGSRLGGKIAKALKFDVSKLGGALLILLAFARLCYSFSSSLFL